MSTVSKHTVRLLPDAVTTTAAITPVVVYSNGFESGVDLWKRQEGTGTPTTAPRSTTLPRDGGYSLAFATATQNLTRVFDVTASEYVLQFWARATNGAGLTTDAGPYRRMISGLSTEWRQLSLTFTVPAGVSTLTLKLWDNGTPGTVYVDDFTLTRNDAVLTAHPIVIEPKELQAALDETWSPYAQATVLAPIPTPAELEQLDPRENVRVQVIMQESFGSSAPVSEFTAAHGGGGGSLTEDPDDPGLYFANESMEEDPDDPGFYSTTGWASDGTGFYTLASSSQTAADLTAQWTGLTAADITAMYFTPYRGNQVIMPKTVSLNLTLRERSTDRVAGEATYTLASDEALLRDYALVAKMPAYPASATVSSAVRFALRKIGAYLGTPVADAGVAEYEALQWVPGVSAWDYLKPILQGAGLRLFCDENRRWQLVPATYNRADSIGLGASRVTAAVETISRDALWWDSVVVIYKWTDSFGVDHVSYTTASTPGVEPTKTYVVTYEGVENHGEGAQLLLNRALGRGRQVEVSAVNDYTARPGQYIVIGLDPTGQSLGGRLAMVRWSLPDDEMTITTRDITEGG